MEMQRPQRGVAQCRDALRLHVRGVVSQPHDREGTHPRHRLVRHARFGMAAAAPRLRAMARAREFHRRRAAKAAPERYHGASTRGRHRKGRFMTGRLNGKVALVTAAGQGIGRAIAEAFIAEGAKVIATDLEDNKLDGLKAVKRLKLDVRSNEAVEALAKTVKSEFGALDVLANIAGYVHQGNILAC